MSKRTVSAADLFEEVEVDLWGNTYRLRTVTRTVGDRLEEQQKIVEGLSAEENTPGELYQALVRLVDVLLEPQGDAPDAKDVLAPKWDSDEIGLDWISRFAEVLQQEVRDRRNPPSAPASGA